MKNTPILFIAVLMCLLGVSCAGSPFRSRGFAGLTSSISSFSVENSLEKIDGLVLHYRKSNLDGSMPSEVSIFYPSYNRSESFKVYPWSKEKGEVYLISAEYDFDRFCASKITGYYVRENGEREKYATISFNDDNSYSMVVNGKKYPALSCGHTPTFNYNFDLTDFNTMYRYLKYDIKNLDIGIIGLADGFVYSGRARLVFDEKRSGRDYSVFTLGGEALNGLSGTVIADNVNKYIKEFDLPLPTTPPYKSFRFVLQFASHMSIAEWHEYVMEKTKQILAK